VRTAMLVIDAGSKYLNLQLLVGKLLSGGLLPWWQVPRLLFLGLPENVWVKTP